MAARGKVEQLIATALSLDGAVMVEGLARVLEDQGAVPAGTGHERAREGLRRYARRHKLQAVKVGGTHVYARSDADGEDLRAAFQASLMRRVRTDPAGLGVAMRACACLLPHIAHRTFSYEVGYLFRRARPERAAMGVESRRTFDQGVAILQGLGYLRLHEMGGRTFVASTNLEPGSVVERHLVGCALDAARERLSLEVERLGLIEPLG